MKFSKYVMEFLCEAEILDQNKIINELIADLPLNLKELIQTNITKFAYKPSDYKKNSRVLNYNKADTETYIKIFNALNANGIHYKVGKDFIQLSQENLKLRQTGAKIESYWKEGENNMKDASKNTAYNEIGVLIWLILLSSKRQELDEFSQEDYLKIKCGELKRIKETIEYLKKEKLKGRGSWYYQTQKTAQGLLDYGKFPKNLDDYEFHRGSSEFDKIKKTGGKLSGLPGATDKWNPSDVFLIKKNKFDISNYTRLEDLNAVMGEFDNIIGISLKGADAGHGAISLENLYKFTGLIPERGKKLNLPKKALDGNGIDYIVKLLKKIKMAAKRCPFLGGVVLYIGNQHKYGLKEKGKLRSIRELLSIMRPKSNNWGISVPPTLAALGALNTEELWDRFAFLGYAIASSQTNFSAPHLKADGNGKVKIINDKPLDPDSFICYGCRIPLSGETNIIFDASYKGVSLKFQFRSKGDAAPQMTIYEKREELTDTNKYSQIKDFKDL